MSVELEETIRNQSAEIARLSEAVQSLRLQVEEMKRATRAAEQMTGDGDIGNSGGYIEVDRSAPSHPMIRLIRIPNNPENVSLSVCNPNASTVQIKDWDKDTKNLPAAETTLATDLMNAQQDSDDTMMIVRTPDKVLLYKRIGSIAGLLEEYLEDNIDVYIADYIDEHGIDVKVDDASVDFDDDEGSGEGSGEGLGEGSGDGGVLELKDWRTGGNVDEHKVSDYLLGKETPPSGGMQVVVRCPQTGGRPVLGYVPLGKMEPDDASLDINTAGQLQIKGWTNTAPVSQNTLADELQSSSSVATVLVNDQGTLKYMPIGQIYYI